MSEASKIPTKVITRDEARKLHKIAILGTSRSGKTTLMVRLSKGQLTEEDFKMRSTRGVDFHVASVERENPKGEKLTLQIWDLAGQDLYRESEIFSNMVLGASAFLFTYDANDPASMREVDKWINLAQNDPKFSQTKKYLIGLKADLVQGAEQIALHKLVEKYLDFPQDQLKHIIVSSHQDINIDTLMGELIDDLAAITDSQAE